MKGICAAIKVNNLEDSLKFYCNGLGYTEYKRLTPNDFILLVFLKDSEGGLLELIYNKNQPEKIGNPIAGNVSIVLGVDNLKTTLETLNSMGYTPEHPIMKLPSGEQIAFIKDPDAVEVELIENFAL